MKIQFLGATRQVTGSQYHLYAAGVNLLVDCGMFQEREHLDRNWHVGRVRPRDLDAILVTHAHLDHCGLIPRLVHEGFRGRIITTAASADLIGLLLRDSAQIQAEDASYKRRRHKKQKHKPKRPVEPLYTMRDVERTLPLLQPTGYEQPVDIGEGVSAVFHDAGHILGSAIVELKVQEGEQTRRIVFSGDLGQWGKPIVRDPTAVAEADYIVMESTYGDRNHRDHGDIETQLADAINSTVEAGGNVVIPIFAIERAQEAIYFVSRLLHAERIPHIPIFLDSPMAAKAINIFRDHRECFDLETWQLITSGDGPFGFPELKLTHSVDESKAINAHKGPAVIMSTSGMCTAGRIKFHLRRNIIRPECTILFVGYQAHGTLGRQIVEGKKDIRIHGRNLQVKARIDQVHGFSGHADRGALMRWLGFLRQPPEKLFLTHGEEKQSLSLAKHIRTELDWNVEVPKYQQTVELE